MAMAKRVAKRQKQADDPEKKQNSKPDDTAAKRHIQADDPKKKQNSKPDDTDDPRHEVIQAVMTRDMESRSDGGDLLDQEFTLDEATLGRIYSMLADATAAAVPPYGSCYGHELDD